MFTDEFKVKVRESNKKGKKTDTDRKDNSNSEGQKTEEEEKYRTTEKEKWGKSGLKKEWKNEKKMDEALLKKGNTVKSPAFHFICSFCLFGF